MANGTIKKNVANALVETTGYFNANINTDYVQNSNLYWNKIGNILFIKGWLSLKAVSIPAGATLFTIGEFTAGQNSVVPGYSNTNPVSEILNGWIEGATNVVKSRYAYHPSQTTAFQLDASIILR